MSSERMEIQMFEVDGEQVPWAEMVYVANPYRSYCVDQIARIFGVPAGLVAGASASTYAEVAQFTRLIDQVCGQEVSTSDE